MKVEIEFNLGAIGSHATFDVFFDENVNFSRANMSFTSMDLGRLECCDAFEHVMIRNLMSIWGFRSATLNDKKLSIMFKDMIVDENQKLIIADNGWNKIHESVVQTIRDYFAYIGIKGVKIILCDDYPKDFILETGLLTVEEMEDIESFQSETES